MKINTAAIIGAGAIGAYLWWGINESLGDNVCFVASGKRKERLEKDGIILNKKAYMPAVKTPAQAKGADLLIIATKYGALREILPDIKEIATENTIVMSVLNGVDSEEIIAEAVSPSQIVYSLIRIASQRVGNMIDYDEGDIGGLFFGERDSKNASSERIDALDELFSHTPLVYHISDDILKEQWSKYAWNLSYNLPQAILNVGIGAYTDSSHVKFISEKIWNETAAVAAAKGIDIGGYLLPRSTLKNTARFSTLQDLDAKRPTEIDMFAGAMIRLGNELHIPVPYCEFAYHAVKALEERGAGKFDYGA